MKKNPEVGDLIFAEWPGESDLIEFSINWVKPDKCGVECAVFGKDGIVGAEATSNLTYDDGLGGWVVHAQ